MSTEATLISGAFGSEVVPVPGLADPSAVGAVSSVPQEQTKVPVSDNNFKNEQGFAQARAARTQEQYRPESNVLVGLGAAVDQWSTTRLIRRLARPRFDNEVKINQAEYLDHTPLVLSEDEREYFMSVGRGQESAAYAIKQIENKRDADRVMSDHPMGAIVGAFADPVWLAIPPAVKIGKARPIAGRLTSAAVGAGIAGTVTALGEGPVSDAEITLSMAMGAGTGALFYRQGKLVHADPEFPRAKIDEAIQSATAGTEAASKPRVKLVQPEKFENVEIPGTPAKYEFQEIRSPELDASKPGYAYQDKQFGLQFANDMDKAAYIVAGKGQSAKHQAILDWAVQHIGVSEEVLVQRGREIRNILKAEAKVSANATLDVKSATTFKPRGKQVKVADEVPARTELRKTQEAIYEELPPSLQPGAINSDPAKVAADVETALVQNGKANGLGSKIMWNMHKTMTGFGPAGKKVANLLYDNNADLGLTSIESHRESVLSGLRASGQIEYEDMLRTAMADDGYGLAKMVNPFTSRAAYAAQSKIEKELQMELFRREQFGREGRVAGRDGVPERIANMADQLDAMHAKALQEMKAAGVDGAENLLERPGYMNRKWSSVAMDDVLNKMEDMGLTREAAHAKLSSLVSLGIRRANTMEKELADKIGAVIVDRAQRKGYFEDGIFNSAAGEGTMKELRDILTEAKLGAADVERAMNVLRVQADDAGKAGMLKHRLDLDYKAAIRVGNEEFKITDLIDHRVTTIVDQYLQQVATQVAFARKGLKKRSDIEALRTELLHDTPREQRAAAKDLFDNSIAHLRGEPAGQAVNENFRLMQAYGRTITLAWSGLWQMTELANAIGEYGLLKTMKYAAQEIPGFKVIMKDKESAHALNNVLAEHSVSSMRLRPYIARFEDGFEMDTGNALQLSAQTAGQMVPYANAMRYVHHKQAAIVGNLILDRLEQAGKGNVKAREALRAFGLEYPVMDKLSAEIQTHGFAVDKWDDAVWAQARPAFGKMMDSAVLKARMGDMPAFAAFDQVGKFVFTYRSFVLAAHNKVLAGNLERNGAGAVGLVLLYQAPLAMAAVQAQATIKGEGVLSTNDLIKKAMGQMGGIGLFSEPLKWATGESNAVGAPGLIPIDRAIKLGANAVQGDFKTSGGTLATMFPVISAVPFVNGMAQQIKE